MKTAIIVYEEKQVPHLIRLLRDEYAGGTDCRVVALNAQTEFLLENERIPFESGRALRTVPHADCLVEAERIGRETLAGLDFFTHRGIRLSELFAVGLQEYLTNLLYYLDMVATLIERNPGIERILVLRSTFHPLRTGPLAAQFNADAVIDAARTASEPRSLKFEVIEMPAPTSPPIFFGEERIFSLRRAAFGLYNFGIALVRRPRKMRILASEYWGNIAPVLKEMPESELVLLDQREILAVGWRIAWKHRMRFLHLENFLSRKDVADAHARQEAFIAAFEPLQANGGAAGEFVFRGYDISSHLRDIVRKIVTNGAEKAVRDINGAYEMLSRLEPDVILLRASVSAQMHFPILAHVGRSLGIPVIEQQHGIFYLGTGSLLAKKRFPAEYIATYGSIVDTALRSAGCAPDKMFPIGSARFDRYAKNARVYSAAPKERDVFSIACIVPIISQGFWNDSYDIMDMLSQVAAMAAAVPKSELLLRLRPGGAHDAFFKEAFRRVFSGIQYRVMQREPMIEVFKRSDVVVSYYSTTVLEALAYNVPTVLLATLPMLAALGEDLKEHERAGALSVARTPQELIDIVRSFSEQESVRRRMYENTRVFAKENYSFDGNASKRLADLMRALASKRS